MSKSKNDVLSSSRKRQRREDQNYDETNAAAVVPSTSESSISVTQRGGVVSTPREDRQIPMSEANKIRVEHMLEVLETMDLAVPIASTHNGEGQTPSTHQMEKVFKILLGWGHQKDINFTESRENFWTRDLGIEVMESILNSVQGSPAINEPIEVKLVLDRKLRELMFGLCSGMDVNVKNSDGESLLHIAVNMQNLHIIKLLLLHGCDINQTCSNNKSALHHCASSPSPNEDIIQILIDHGAKRCSTVRGCKPACSKNGRYKRNIENQEEIEWQPEYRDLIQINLDGKDYNKKGDRVLCLDGGGQLGILQLQILDDLSHQSNMRPCQMFNYFFGSSAGALNCIGLVLDWDIEILYQLYYEHSIVGFAGTPDENSQTLANILQGYTGEKKLKDVEKTNIGMSAVNVTTSIPVLEVISNIGSLREINKDIRLLDAALMSSAAPVFFAPHQSYYDGGLQANNITGVAANVLYQEFQTTPHIINLGSGLPPIQRIDAADYRVATPLLHPQNFTSLPAIGKLCLTCLTDCNGTVVNTSVNLAHRTGMSYTRCTPKLREAIPFNCRELETLLELRWTARCYTIKHTKAMLNMVKLVTKK